MISLRRLPKLLLPRSLFGRSLLIIILPLILLQLVSAWIFYDRHWDRITWRLAVNIAGDIQYVFEEIREAPDRIPAILDRAHRAMELRITLQPGAILPPGGKPPESLIDRRLAAALDERLHLPLRIDSSSFAERVIIDLQMADGVMTVVAPGRRLFSSTTYIFILWMVGTSLVLFSVALVFMRNQVRPIRRLAEAADGFGKGRDPGQDFKLEGAAEVRQTATAFNRMMRRIRRQLRQRTDMLSAVSHDLKTPLTRMTLQLALLEDSAETRALKANIAEMKQMIEGYLTFARGEGDEPVASIDLTALLTALAATWAQGGVTLDCHVEGNIRVWARPDALRRCIDNLVGNARRYAGSIWLTAGRRGDDIEILVDDDGPGIAEDQREEAFRPFARLEPSRNPETGGTGLGLAISRDIARSHGGDILLEQSPHGGLRARVLLPV